MSIHSIRHFCLLASVTLSILSAPALAENAPPINIIPKCPVASQINNVALYSIKTANNSGYYIAMTNSEDSTLPFQVILSGLKAKNVHLAYNQAIQMLHNVDSSYTEYAQPLTDNFHNTLYYCMYKPYAAGLPANSESVIQPTLIAFIATLYHNP